MATQLSLAVRVVSVLFEACPSPRFLTHPIINVSDRSFRDSCTATARQLRRSIHIALSFNVFYLTAAALPHAWHIWLTAERVLLFDGGLSRSDLPCGLVSGCGLKIGVPVRFHIIELGNEYFVVIFQ